MINLHRHRILTDKNCLLKHHFEEASFAFGASGRIRTDYLFITNELLYRVSYGSILLLPFFSLSFEKRTKNGEILQKSAKGILENILCYQWLARFVKNCKNHAV